MHTNIFVREIPGVEFIAHAKGARSSSTVSAMNAIKKTALKLRYRGEIKSVCLTWWDDADITLTQIGPRAYLAEWPG